MSFISDIRKLTGDSVEPIKVAVWQDEMAIYVGEKEIPISIFPNEKGDAKVVLDVQGYEWKLRARQVWILGNIMEYCHVHMDEIREMTETYGGDEWKKLDAGIH